MATTHPTIHIGPPARTAVIMPETTLLDADGSQDVPLHLAEDCAATFIIRISDITVTTAGNHARLAFQLLGTDPSQSEDTYGITHELRFWSTGIYVVKIAPWLETVHLLAYRDTLPEDVLVRLHTITDEATDTITFTVGMNYTPLGMV